MKKINNLLILALLAIGMGLTSCDEQLDNALTPTVTSILLDADEMELNVGDEGQLKVIVDPADATVTWSSDKESVATVDATGKVTAVAEGIATITATAGDKTTVCTITVTNLLAMPLTLEAISAGKITVTSPKDGMKVSKNGGAKTAITANPTEINVAAGDKVAFYGTATSYAGTSIGGSGDGFKCKVFGNIMSLLYEDFADKTELPTDTKTFTYLFWNNTTLTDASGLLLPATTLTTSCYLNMFHGCTALTSAPKELPATNLVNHCYQEMFFNCEALTSAPELKATDLAQNCYFEMFFNCKALTSAPELKATDLTGADYCYEAMFQNCTSLTTAPELPATELATCCYYMMFQGCTSLTTTPELPATELAKSCYNQMFYGCSNLTETPKLLATTLADNSYKNMFQNCSSLTKAYVKAAYDAGNCADMFKGCTAAGAKLHTTSANKGSWSSAITSNSWTTWTADGDWN